jgi:hypothetical protein
MARKIGELFTERGLLTEGQVRCVLEHTQKTKSRFGESVLELGYLSARDLKMLLGESREFDFLYVELSDVSEKTRNLFPQAFLIEHGVLPLGFDRKSGVFGSSQVLRVGMTQPQNLRARLAIEQAARELLGEKYGGIKFFLILSAHFESIFRVKYGASPVEAATLTRVVGERTTSVPMFKDDEGCQMMHLMYRETLTPPEGIAGLKSPSHAETDTKKSEDPSTKSLSAPDARLPRD